jgi:hypothetical protein
LTGVRPPLAVLSRVTVSREMPKTIPEQPAVRIVDGATGPRPAVSGTGLDVWEIVETVAEHGGSLSEAAAYLEVHPGGCRDGHALLPKPFRLLDRERAGSLRAGAGGVEARTTHSLT